MIMGTSIMYRAHTYYGVGVLQHLVTEKFLCRLSYCIARPKADLVRPVKAVICQISFLVFSDAAIIQQEAKVIWEQTALTSPRGHMNRPTMKILRGGRRKWKLLGLPLGTGKASGAWIHNFLRQLPCSKQARAESCDQHGRKSTKSIGNQSSRVES